MRESIRIVRQALDGLPAGPVCAEMKGIVAPDREQMKAHMDAVVHHFQIMGEGFRVPPGEVYQAVESPRGEMGYYVVSDGGSRPYRVKVRSPSFANLQALPRIAEGRNVSDLVACLGSIDVVVAEVDR
jgi:NADH-quinone oxidoreductase subunit D